jgi:tRNA U34 5-carboxymethylaminomethyl modifying GTPase MnmE/TrmE
MDSKTYTEKRNQLISLLQDGVDLPEKAGMPELSDKFENELQLSETLRKIQEDQFEIVIVGAFQSGKSTTIDALCGRDVSPTGDGNKTTASVVSVKHIADPDVEEFANIKWRTSKTLLAGLDNVFDEQLKKIDPDRFSKSGNQSMLLDLDNEEDLKILSEVANAEIEQWKENKALYGSDSLDRVRFGLIISTFYKDTQIQELLRQDKYTIEEARSYLTFPPDWETRWAEGDVNRFNPKEVAFAFILNVTMNMRSSNLARIGAKVTDCPGLFASKWDSFVASSAMKSADAILYLFNGERQLSESESEALLKINRMGFGHKLFYAMNVWGGKNFENSRALLNTNKAIIQARGFKIDIENTILFHANMAFCADSAKQHLNDNLSTSTKEHLNRSLPGMKSDDLDKSITNKLLKRLNRCNEDLEIREDDYEWEQCSLEMAVEDSRIQQVVSCLENYVVLNRAKFILLDNGSYKIKQGFKEIEGSLQQQEKILEKNRQSHELEFKEAEKLLNTFERNVSNNNKQWDNHGIDSDFANDLWDQITEDLDTFINSSWTKVQAINTSFQLFGVEEKLKNTLEQEFKNYVEEHVTRWENNLHKNQNKVFNEKIKPMIEDSNNCLKTEWESVKDNHLDILNEIEIKALSGNLLEDLRSDDSGGAFSNVSEDIAGDTRNSNILQLGGIGLAIVASVLVFIPGGLIVNLAMMLAGILIAWWKKKEPSPPTKKYQESIRDAFGSTEVKEKFSSKSKSTFSFLRTKYKEQFEEMVKHPRKVFEQRKAEAEKTFNKSQEEKEAIAKKAHDVRVNFIEPFRMDIEEFEKECELAFSNVENSA